MLNDLFSGHHIISSSSFVMFQMMFSVSEMSQAWTDDKSLEEAIKLTSFSVSASDPLMQLFTSSIIMAGTGADVDHISAKYLDAGESFEGPETVLPKGMSQILER